MRLWKKFLIVGVVLSVIGCIPFEFDLWVRLPATIIVAIGIVSIIYDYLVKRTYG